MILTKDNTGEELILIRSADIDRFNDASIPFFFATCQDAGGLHSEILGYSAEKLLKEKGWTWIILRNRINFYKIPHYCQRIKVVTWAQDGYKLFFPRMVSGYDENGDKVFDAMTEWVLFDVVHKRPMRPSVLENAFPVPREEMLKDPSTLGKMKSWDEQEKKEILPPAFPKPGYYDVDLNKHINNVVYVKWIVSALDDDFLESHVPVMMDVSWITQTFEHDEVRVETAILEEGDDGNVSFLHRIIKKNEKGEEKECFSALSSWRRK